MLNFLEPYQKRVNSALELLLPDPNKEPKELFQAMRYSVIGTGKRVRPALVYTVGDELSADKRILDIAAASIEMFHVFSLIHDDLPCIDNSDLRHHKPSCHKAFGESTALLAGDALLAYGMKNLADISCNLDQHKLSAKLLSVASIALMDLVSGEELDTRYTSSVSDVPTLKNIYNKKTVALITASVEIGGRIGGCDENVLKHLISFAQDIGLAFQIKDDIIDIESSSEIMGKPQLQDVKVSKVTYPSLIGMDQSKKAMQELYNNSIENLKNTGMKFKELRQLADLIINRDH